MQIKKGPFGYFAVEKLDSPDRLCSYAEEVIAGNKSDFYLRPSAEYVGAGVLCCFEFSGYVQITDPEFSVFPSDHRFSSHKKESRILSLRRKAAGDLFYSFIRFLDYLVSPSCIVIDPDMVFTDTEGIAIKLCCLPVKSTPDALSLSSLGAARFEKLLSCDFFKSVITEDERNALVYSVKEDNEEMFLRLVKNIKGENTGEVQTGALISDSDEDNDTEIRKRSSLSKTKKDLIFSALSALVSAAFLFSRMYLSSIVLFLLSLIILVSVFITENKQKERGSKERALEKSRQRSSILFSDNPVLQDNEQTEPGSDTQITDTEKNNIHALISGKLTLISSSKGINSDYSVYLDKTCIGSDCFLSDIVLDDALICPLHAVILKRNGSFYIEGTKGSGATFIENSRIENGKTYEIKSGQKITFGDIEFRFITEKANRAGYY